MVLYRSSPNLKSDFEFDTPTMLRSCRLLSTRTSRVDIYCRLLAYSRHRRPGRQRRSTSLKTKAKKEEPSPPLSKETGASASLFVRDWILPVRFRLPQPLYYTSEQGWALAYRLPVFLALATLLVAWDETSPISFIGIHGPSMLPTMAPDGSEVWLSLHRRWWWWSTHPQRGELVGFAHPDHPHQVSCKRIVGVAGDEVLRYGEYIDLYAKHDPRYWGISPLDRTRYPWVADDWDAKRRAREDHPRATFRVPKDHVWLEADCPGFGIDSRQIGPVPVQWLRGRIVTRVWPLGGAVAHNRRPSPIPLNPETLRQYNVHKMKKADS